MSNLESVAVVEGEHESSSLLLQSYFCSEEITKLLLSHVTPEQCLALAQLAFARRYYALDMDWNDRNGLGKGKQTKVMRRLEERMDRIQKRYDELFDGQDVQTAASAILLNNDRPH